MKQLQQTQVKQVIAPAAIVDDAAFASNVIDTQGMSYIEFHVSIGAIDIAPAVMKVMESDTKSDATTLGGTPALVLDLATKPTAAAGDNTIVVIGVDLTKRRERYLQLQITGGDGTAGTYLAANAVCVMDGVTSSDATDRGVANAEYV